MRNLIAAPAPLPNLALADIAGPARVFDGDTIEVAGSASRTTGTSSAVQGRWFALYPGAKRARDQAAASRVSAARPMASCRRINAAIRKPR